MWSLKTILFLLKKDPVVFSGTIRSNVDPFNLHEDYEVWKALELSYLNRFVKDQPAGLNYECGEAGETLR